MQESISTTESDAASHQRLEDTFTRCQAELLGTLYYLTGNREDAQDALQEAFVKCWRRLQQVSEVQNLRAWVFRIALNTGRDMRQTAWRRKRQALPEESSMLSSGDDPTSHAMREERESALRDAIWELRDEEKEVFLLRQNGELTYDEIGAALAVPVGTVKTRMRAALRRLRRMMEASDL